MPPDDFPLSPRQAEVSPGSGSGRRRWVARLVVLAWGTLMIVPPLYLVANRTAWLASLEAPAAQENWEEFRSAMRAESGAVPEPGIAVVLTSCPLASSLTTPSQASATTMPPSAAADASGNHQTFPGLTGPLLSG